MTIRESLEKNKAWIVPVILIASVVALFFSIKGFTSPGISTLPINRAYYSDDDGKTYFEDELGKSTPFDRAGKKAYRAYVFRCGNGQPIVGFLGRQTAGATKPNPANNKASSSTADIEIRKPGTDNWVKFDSPDGGKIISGVCPDGHPMAVVPGQPDDF